MNKILFHIGMTAGLLYMSTVGTMLISSKMYNQFADHDRKRGNYELAERYDQESKNLEELTKDIALAPITLPVKGIQAGLDYLAGVKK